VLFKPDIIRNLLRFHAVHEVVEKFPGAEMLPVQYAFFDFIRCNRNAHLKSTPLKGAVIMIGTAVMIQIPETARTIQLSSGITHYGRQREMRCIQSPGRRTIVTV
jgi:hypothetical protein